jgi:NAD+ kinase
VNTGRLGFLAALSSEGIHTALEALLKGNYTIDERVLLQCESSEPLFDYNVALNDFVLHKRESSSMIVVHAYLNGEFMNTYWADGLIISTPTGSTGYSLACGGPIIFPRSGNFVITPIAPHNLNVRPIVVRDEFVISFELEGRASSYMASLDSRSTTVPPYMQIAVRRADHKFRLVRPEGHNFLDNLRNKLSWGLDRRN